MATPQSRKPSVEPTTSLATLLVDGNDAAFRQFVHDLLAFSARLQAVRDSLGAIVGLSGAEYTTLIAIAHLSANGEKVGINMVAEHLHFSGAFITIGVNKMVALGLVAKRVDSEDRRRVILRITPKARALLNQLAPVQRPANDRLFDCLTTSDFDRLSKRLPMMVDAADDVLRTLEALSEAKRRRAAREA